LDAYTEYSLSLEPGFRRWLSERWWYQFGRSIGRIARKPGIALAALLSDGESRNDIIEFEQLYGRAIGLLRHNKRYGDLRREVRNASWRRPQEYSEDRLEKSSDHSASLF
jgi:hypothetical protein